MGRSSDAKNLKTRGDRCSFLKRARAEERLAATAAAPQVRHRRAIFALPGRSRKEQLRLLTRLA